MVSCPRARPRLLHLSLRAAEVCPEVPCINDTLTNLDGPLLRWQCCDWCHLPHCPRLPRGRGRGTVPSADDSLARLAGDAFVARVCLELAYLPRHTPLSSPSRDQTLKAGSRRPLSA